MASYSSQYSSSVGNGPMSTSNSKSGSVSSEVSHEEYLEVTATNTTTGIYSSSSSAWYMKNGLGAKYTVTNLNGDVVYYMGTMCGNGDDSVCEMCLAPGCYMYRVDGAFDEQADKVKWNFCDKEGGVSSQLYFCIGEDYKCYPKKVVEVDEICESYEKGYAYIFGYKEIKMAEAPVSLAGTFELGGKMAPLTEVDEEAIKAAINKEFTDASMSKSGE
eukprot:gene49632-66485_t